MRALKAANKILVLWILLLTIPTQAFAAVSFNCAGTLLEDPDIPDIATCESAMALDTLISSSICLLRAVMGQSMFEVYCEIMEAMQEPIKAALTLWIIFYAIAVMFGIGNASGRDIIMRLMKIIIIIAFAANAELFFFFMYKFFIYGLLEGVSTFFFELNPSDAYGTGPDLVPGAPTDYEVNIAGIFAYIDQLFFTVIGSDRLVALGVLMAAYAATGMGIMVTILLMIGVLSLIGAFFRILITYAVAIIALTFLLMFAPLFLAFALFERTMSLFTGWLAAIISYTIQPIIVLAFIFLFAAVSDTTEFITKIRCNNTNIQAVIDGTEPCDSKIDENAVQDLDLIFMQLSSQTPRFTELTGEIDSGGTVIEDAETFREDFKEAMFFALAFLILNMIMNGFLRQVPSFAQMLARFGGASTTPAIAMSSGSSWVRGTGAQNVGVFTPDRFLTGSNSANQVRGIISSGEGIFGRAVGGGSPSPGVRRHNATK